MRIIDQILDVLRALLGVRVIHYYLLLQILGNSLLVVLIIYYNLPVFLRLALPIQ